MNGLSPLLPLFFALAACAPSNESSSGGGKADDLTSGNGDIEFSCKVVQVLDDNVLEEGLASIYDFERDGFPFFDEDSVDVGYETSDLSRLSSKRILSIGQMNIGLHSDADVISESVEPADFADTDVITVEGNREESSIRYRVRVFASSRVGYITYFAADPAGCFTREQAECELNCGGLDCGCDKLAAKECEQEHDLARIDCRGIEAPDYSAF
jgi:hypothetical protein